MPRTEAEKHIAVKNVIEQMVPVFEIGYITTLGQYIRSHKQPYTEDEIFYQEQDRVDQSPNYVRVACPLRFSVVDRLNQSTINTLHAIIENPGSMNLAVNTDAIICHLFNNITLSKNEKLSYRLIRHTDNKQWCEASDDLLKPENRGTLEAMFGIDGLPSVRETGGDYLIAIMKDFAEDIKAYNAETLSDDAKKHIFRDMLTTLPLVAANMKATEIRGNIKKLYLTACPLFTLFTAGIAVGLSMIVNSNP